MKIDVVLLTKNSERMLSSCLESIFSNIPINRLVVVDGHSTDKTLEIVENFCYCYNVPMVLIFDCGTRATARQKGIDILATKWFMFIDSDVVLNPNWFNDEVLSLMSNPRVGAVDGYDFPVVPAWALELREAMSLLRSFTRRIVKRGFSGGRFDSAFTGDTLIRTEAVKGIKIPSYLHICEDSYIRGFIEKRGFKWIVSEKSTCIHYLQTYRERDIIDRGALGYKMGFLKSSDVFRASLTVVPKGILPA